MTQLEKIAIGAGRKRGEVNRTPAPIQLKTIVL
jgi:hypothetical protein